MSPMPDDLGGPVGADRAERGPAGRPQGPWSLLGLPSVRALSRPGPYRRLWALCAVAYVTISMFLGQMLEVYPQGTGGSNYPAQLFFYTSTEQVSNPYLVPGLLFTSSHVVLALSLWPTIAMVALGVFIGLAVSTSVALLVSQRRARAPTAATAAAPVITGWGLLGACCCTSCATQVAAVGVVGATSGASTAELMRTAWPLAVLQLAVVLATVYYMELRLRRPVADTAFRPVGPGRTAAALLLRVALIIGGVTWLFSLVVELLEPSSLSAALAYHWVFEHAALGLFAFAGGFVPLELYRWAGRHRRGALASRFVLALAGITWGIGVPPVLASGGLGGTVNELLGYLGAPASWGAVPPDGVGGLALAFHWAFQHVLISAWAIACAAVPSAAFAAALPGAVRVGPLPAPAPVAAADSAPSAE